MENSKDEDLKKSSASKDTIQEHISAGRKIVMLKQEGEYKIQIRFNHWDIDGTRKWRVIMDGVEFLVSEIEISIKSKTESEYIEEEGFKHHIIAFSNNVFFDNQIAYIN